MCTFVSLNFVFYYLITNLLFNYQNCKIMQKEDEVESQRNYIVIAIIAGAIVIAFWLVNYDIMVDSKGTDLFGERGTFGDMFGAVNALFSGLAFAGLIVTLIMQHDELKLQREEISQTNKELAAQKKEFEEQNKTLKVQRFENTLFNLLAMQQRIVEGLIFLPYDGADTTPPTKGISIFDMFYNKKTVRFKYLNENAIYGIKDLIRCKKNIYVYRDVRDISILDSYFRHLYRIFKYIDESSLIEDNERYEYTCIVRAQLSDYELLMLFYNALANDDNGESKFKRLIEKYAIFNNLRQELLANETDAKLYEEPAYNRQCS